MAHVEMDDYTKNGCGFWILDLELGTFHLDEISFKKDVRNSIYNTFKNYD